MSLYALINGLVAAPLAHAVEHALAAEAGRNAHALLHLTSAAKQQSPDTLALSASAPQHSHGAYSVDHLGTFDLTSAEPPSFRGRQLAPGVVLKVFTASPRRAAAERPSVMPQGP